MLEPLVDQLSRTLDMKEAISPSQRKGYFLKFDDHLTVELRRGEGHFFFKAEVGQMPLEKEELLIKVMEANLFGSGTRGGALGLDRDEKMLTLTMQLDYNVPFPVFYEKLEDFVSVCHFWRQEISGKETDSRL